MLPLSLEVLFVLHGGMTPALSGGEIIAHLGGCHSAGVDEITLNCSIFLLECQPIYFFFKITLRVLVMKQYDIPRNKLFFPLFYFHLQRSCGKPLKNKQKTSIGFCSVSDEH